LAVSSTTERFLIYFEAETVHFVKVTHLYFRWAGEAHGNPLADIVAGYRDGRKVEKKKRKKGRMDTTTHSDF